MKEELQKTQTERILIGVREGNEYQALAAADLQISGGLVNVLGDEMTEWKYYLIKMLTLLSYITSDDGSMSHYLDHLAADFMKKIYAADTKEKCGKLLKDMIKQYCGANEHQLKKYSPLVQKIITEVAIDLKAPLTLQYFSDELNVNGSYLSNLFRKETGQTITQFVTGKRINHAANLLRYSQEPVKTVAKQVGITDVQYFSRLFKRRMGITPTQYREGNYAGGPEDEVF